MAVALNLNTERPAGTFDLITASYLHTGGGLDRDRMLSALAPQVASGGAILLIDHGSVAPWSWNQHAREFPTPQQTYDALCLPEGWAPIHLERATRTATGPNARTAEVADIVVAAKNTV